MDKLCFARTVMRDVPCAICEEYGNYQVMYKPNFDLKTIDSNVFSARRVPDRKHYQIVRCKKCSLVYSNPILDQNRLESLYYESKFTYGNLLSDLTLTYSYYLKRAAEFVKSRQNFLEIGCGNGFLLQVAKELGFQSVFGAEPSKDAVSLAPPSIRQVIKNDFFRSDLFEKNKFDLVCFFQTLDHIPNPNLFLKGVFQVIKPGGIVLALNHDVGALSARMLGEKSPIFDIEHTFLYDKRTFRNIFEKNGFRLVKVESSFSIYSFGYWFSILPFKSIKPVIADLLYKLALDKVPFKIKGGNIYLIGQKPN